MQSLEVKPQMQNIVQQPATSARAPEATIAPAPAKSVDTKSEGLSPGLLPIPVPDDFQHEPRWNPGLLSEQDHTALRSPTSKRGSASTTELVGLRSVESSTASRVEAEAAWGSKVIHWASFDGAEEKQPGAERHSDKIQSQQTAAQLASNQSLKNSGHLELNAPVTGLRDPLPGQRVSTAGAPVGLPRQVITQPGHTLEAKDVRMVPLPPPMVERQSTELGHLELSPSSGPVVIP
jgi:hypothetical protein